MNKITVTRDVIEDQVNNGEPFVVWDLKCKYVYEAPNGEISSTKDYLTIYTLDDLKELHRQIGDAIVEEEKRLKWVMD